MDNASSKPSTKSNQTALVVVVVILLCLCCCGIITLAGSLYLIKSGKLPTWPSLMPRPTAGPGLPHPPTTETGPLVVEPFDPSHGTTIPTLQELANNWEGSSTPATNKWEITVMPNRRVLVLMGWCASTKDILEENYKHLEWRLTVDDQPVDVSRLYEWEETLSDRVCRTYVGRISHWPGATHTIVTTMHLEKAINDGWDDYPAGDYVDIYQITVRR